MKRFSASNRRRLDRRLVGLDEQIGPCPEKGWIRLIRTALGMNTPQLAFRLGITPRRVLQIEQAEVEGRIRLSTLARAAAAMQCRLCYAFVPDESLTTMVHRQARKVAREELKSEGLTVCMEGESIEEHELVELIEAARAYELIDSLALWQPSGNRTRPVTVNLS